ncbi:hypothetical protein CTEN210_08170 [Chaetoceros tenuissimus]|uniref:Uncharacterized protein n=1 Tax=Chaetoceros tenuissimus TaxID=426638 RepID=A0AAD3H6G4_9STRA|nr:hypothetical protein CTEN210_08170 [Chaetoceros tenuissimus]
MTLAMKAVDRILAVSGLFFAFTYLLDDLSIKSLFRVGGSYGTVQNVASMMDHYKHGSLFLEVSKKEKEMESFMKDKATICSSEVKGVYEAYKDFEMSKPYIAKEIFKLCYMYHELRVKGRTIARYRSADSFTLQEDVLISLGNAAVVDEQNKLVHDSLLIVSADQKEVLIKLIEFILHQKDSIAQDFHLLSQKLCNLIHEEMEKGSKWALLPIKCDFDIDNRFTYKCQVHNMGKTVLLTNVKDMDAINYDEITNIQSKSVEHTKSSPRNLYHDLKEKNCLPTDRICEACLKDSKGGTCLKCHSFCGCFCDEICSTKVEEKVLSKIFEYKAPSYTTQVRVKSMTTKKLIPRIVHQTWFEPITRKKYPNFSRLVESWNQTGWKYAFYDDDDASQFISEHFPPEVKEAYDTLNPGAFKADLFRYCLLFIKGGVYADVDVMAESLLDSVIDDDSSFISPVDSVGEITGHQHCLWNGLIASSPGHPFLAATIEAVVNNVRNRFTTVDIMDGLCPGPIDFYTAHRYDLLFTTGPCILGISINKFLGRPPQTSFYTNETLTQESFPGKAIFLEANKEDMGAHRFTMTQKNYIVAATDIPGSDDRNSVKGHDQGNHYSKIKKHGRVFGSALVYKDENIANERVKFEAKSKSFV